jgi:hypothetical protein
MPSGDLSSMFGSSFEIACVSTDNARSANIPAGC